MEDLTPFISHLSAKVSLSPYDLDQFIKAFKMVRVKKRQFIIQPGFVATQRAYVLKGAFRAYVVDEKGIDQTIQFAIEDWWITDYNSYIYQTPATHFVVALEDSIVLQIDYEDEQQLKAYSHQAETLFRIMAEKSAAYLARRIISNFTQNAEQRYTEFIETYPNAVQRLPQYVIASYLNMTREFLSKIRHDKAYKK